MKKNLRYIIAFLLAIMMLLSLCACAQTGTAGNSGGLDLDYVGEDNTDGVGNTPATAGSGRAGLAGRQCASDATGPTCSPTAESLPGPTRPKCPAPTDPEAIPLCIAHLRPLSK